MVHFAQVNETIAMDSRHVRVALGNHDLRLFGGGFDDIHTHSKTHVAMGVRRRSLDKRDVYRNLALANQSGDL